MHVGAPLEKHRQSRFATLSGRDEERGLALAVAEFESAAVAEEEVEDCGEGFGFVVLGVWEVGCECLDWRGSGCCVVVC